MRTLFATLFLLLGGVPVISGVGDAYNCTETAYYRHSSLDKNKLTEQYEFYKKTIGERTATEFRVTWLEKGIIVKNICCGGKGYEGRYEFTSPWRNTTFSFDACSGPDCSYSFRLLNDSLIYVQRTPVLPEMEHIPTEIVISKCTKL